MITRKNILKNVFIIVLKDYHIILFYRFDVICCKRMIIIIDIL